MKILGIFDAGEATVDRYTVVTDEKEKGWKQGVYTMLGLSDGGEFFSQWTFGVFVPGGDNSHLGKELKMSDLNIETREHIERRIKE